MAPGGIPEFTCQKYGNWSSAEGMASGQTQPHRNSISTQPSLVVQLAALYCVGTRQVGMSYLLKCTNTLKTYYTYALIACNSGGIPEFTRQKYGNGSSTEMDGFRADTSASQLD
jgi:hypothetical protein